VALVLAHREDQKTCSARINIVHFSPPAGGLMRGARAPFRSRGSVRLGEFKRELRECHCVRERAARRASRESRSRAEGPKARARRKDYARFSGRHGR